MQITVDRRKHRILQIMSVGVKQCGPAEPTLPSDQDIIDPLIGRIGVAHVGQIGPWRPGRDRRRQRQTFGFGAQHHRERHATTGGGAEDGRLLRIVGLHHGFPDRHRVVHRSRIRKVRRHPVIDRDHLEPAISRHHQRFRQRRPTRCKYVAATMDVNQHAVGVLRRHGVWRDDERLHAADDRILDCHTQLFGNARDGLGDHGGPAVDQVVPFGCVLRVGIHIGREWRGDHGLELGADLVVRDRDALRRSRARTRLAVRGRLVARQLVITGCRLRPSRRAKQQRCGHGSLKSEPHASSKFFMCLNLQQDW